MPFLQFAHIATLGFRAELDPAPLRQAQGSAAERLKQRLPEPFEGRREDAADAELKLALSL
jgi:hypothetical protein